MKRNKLKVLSSLAILGIAGLGLAACNNNTGSGTTQSPTQTPTENGGGATTPTPTQRLFQLLQVNQLQRLQISHQQILLNKTK